MFKDTKAFSGFSVDNLQDAKNFYGQTLGLPVSEENDLLTVHIAGGRDILVYPKENHVPATYTVLNFPVSDIESAVDDLVARGVTFQRYEGFDQDERGIAHDGGPAIAWFTD